MSMHVMFNPRFRFTPSLPGLLLAGLTLGQGLPASASSSVPASAAPTMRERIERYGTDLGALERFHNVGVSTSRVDRLQRFFEDEAQSLDAVEFETLEPSARIDFLLLKNQLRYERRHLEHERRRQTESAALIPFAPVIARLEEARRRMEAVDPPRGAKALVEMAGQIDNLAKDLEKRSKAGQDAKPSLPLPSVVSRAQRETEDLRQTLKSWFDFYADYDPDFTWWTREPYQKVEKALQGYSDRLGKVAAGRRDDEKRPEDESDAIIGDPIGRAALLDALEYEMIPYSPEELVEIANQEFAWCEAEYRRAARDMGLGDDWRAALERVKELHVRPGEQPQLIKKLALEAITFLKERDLVTIPALCEETWRMEMMSPERQRVNPFFTGGEVISVSFPTSGMSHEDKLMSMRGNNIHFSRATVHHELIPGHHLQGFMAQRHRNYRRTFRTAFLVEGWALYWEMQLWDLGFPKTPEDRIGMLFWRSHRCARIIFSLNFHLGKMTPRECIDFLVDRVGHERRNAEGEVRRSFGGLYNPLYQAAYMLGGLQIRALYQELVASGKWTARRFHDAILKENSIPIEMIRASLTGQALTRDHKPEWRFYPSDQLAKPRAD